MIMREYVKMVSHLTCGMSSLQPTLNPKPIITKFETRDYVGESCSKNFFGSIRPEDFAPPLIYPKYTLKTFECLLHFFSSSEPQQRRPLD